MAESKTKCRLCRSTEVEVAKNFGPQPINHHFLSCPDSAEKRYPLLLGVCKKCALIQLLDPIDPNILYADYFTLSSWKPQPHTTKLVELLSQFKYIDTNTKIVEIGSNDGSFLAQLRDSGFKNVIGIEPANDAAQASIANKIETFHKFLSPESAKEFVEKYGTADLIICRHVLEHIQDLEQFKTSFTTIVKPGTKILFEIPYFDFCLDSLDYGSLWEEHCNFFTKNTLLRFLSDIGVEVSHHFTTLFSGVAQIAFGEVNNNHQTKATLEVNAEIIKLQHYVNQFPKFKDNFRSFLTGRIKKGERVVAFGAGSRTQVFLNLLECGDLVSWVIDDQLEKQHQYLPGTKLFVLPSATLLESRNKITTCLLGVNAENENKVITKFKKFEEMGGKFFSLHAPSARIAPVWSELGATSIVDFETSLKY